MSTVYLVAGAMLVVAASLTTYRLLKGPNTLDRVVATDALVAIAMGGLAVWAAFSGNSSVLPAVVALSLVGFVGSTSVARFRVPDDAGVAPSNWLATDPRRDGERPVISDVLSATMILTGALFALTAAIGIVRFPDTLTRMHAATKPQTLGLLLLLGGSAIKLRDSVDVWMLVLAGLFALLTAPVVAHRVGRVAYQEQRLRDRTIGLDDMETGNRD